MPEDARLSTHFHAHEFTCRCGCGLCEPHPDLILALEQLRALIRAPIIITSAHRCPKHNAAVGGGPSSEHLAGRAVDIHAPALSLYELFAGALNVPLFEGGGIGIYPKQQFLHLDIREDRCRWARNPNHIMRWDAALEILALGHYAKRRAELCRQEEPSDED
jgi:hypothetical protein